MMLCSRYETGKILEGVMSGLVRVYPPGDGCPIKVGDAIVLTSQYAQGPQGGALPVPFCKATVISVRPITVAQLMAGDEVLRMDGWDNGPAWRVHFGLQYPGMDDATPVHYVRFRVDQIDKQGLRA